MKIDLQCVPICFIRYPKEILISRSLCPLKTPILDSKLIDFVFFSSPFFFSDIIDADEDMDADGENADDDDDGFLNES
jgi:hypothetical protein